MDDTQDPRGSHLLGGRVVTGGPAGVPWWEFDPDEKPIPLGAEGEWGLADDAEVIVNSEREAIARENTDPTLQTLVAMRAAGRDGRSGRGVFLPSQPRSVRVVAIVLLLAGCVALFSHGWSRGVAARESRDRPGSVSLRRVSGQEDSRVNQATSKRRSGRFTRGLRDERSREAKSKEVPR